MSLQLKIRAEQASDLTSIGPLITRAFATASHSDGTEAQIVEQLRQSGALTLSLVALRGETLVGHVAFSPVTIDGQGLEWYGLGPVAVEPTLQGGGIGKALIEEGLARLRQMGADGCVLLGEPEYYGRFGFLATPRLVLDGVPAEYFQALSFTGEIPEGRVEYHLAFSQTPTVRQFGVKDFADYKAIRLEALAREPGSFLSNHAREAAMSDDEWRGRLARADGAVFGVYVGDEICGVTGVVVDSQNAEQGVLVQSYLRAELRGRGHSRLLYQARIGWARETGLRSLKVSHRADNQKSREAILRHGFQRTGTESVVWPDGTVAEEWLYVRHLSEE